MATIVAVVVAVMGMLVMLVKGPRYMRLWAAALELAYQLNHRVLCGALEVKNLSQELRDLFTRDQLDQMVFEIGHEFKDKERVSWWQVFTRLQRVPMGT